MPQLARHAGDFRRRACFGHLSHSQEWQQEQRRGEADQHAHPHRRANRGDLREHTGEHGDYEDVRHWGYHYCAFDSLWFASGIGERFAYRQLSDADSELSKEGRDLCRRIEAGAGVPTYYYLMRYFARSKKGELKSRCPDCGGEWLNESDSLKRYEFRCDRCRLVSNIADDVA